MSHKTHGGIIDRLTFEERQLIEKYLKDGLSGIKISERINRSKNCINTELRKIGREIYTAKEAQKKADECFLSKYEKLSQRNKGNQVTFKIKQRIENLEMQVEILHDIVKEMIKR